MASVLKQLNGLSELSECDKATAAAPTADHRQATKSAAKQPNYIPSPHAISLPLINRFQLLELIKSPPHNPPIIILPLFSTGRTMLIGKKVAFTCAPFNCSRKLKVGWWDSVITISVTNSKLALVEKINTALGQSPLLTYCIKKKNGFQFLQL